MGKYISLSYVLSPQLSCYNDQLNIQVLPFKNREKEIRLKGHVGTHIDVPSHVFENGKKITDYSIERFIYRNVAIARVNSTNSYVEPDDLPDIPENVDFLIIETGAWKHRHEATYTSENHGISERTASYLCSHFPNLKAVGIDSISINAYKDKASGRNAHKIFLGREKEILIVEDMDLSRLGDAHIQQLIVAPLFVEDCDGAPCQIIAQLGEPLKYDAIFFDWDGVITDSVNVKTDAFCEMFRQYGETVQQRVKAHHLKNGGMSRYEKFKFYYREYLGEEIDDRKLQELVQQFSSLVKEKVIRAPYVPGAVETIHSESQKETKLFVVSGTPTEEMKDIVRARRLENFFTDVGGSPSKKEEWVRFFCEKYALDAEKCLFIGDAMADFHAAAVCGTHFIAVKIPGCMTDFPASVTIKTAVEL